MKKLILICILICGQLTIIAQNKLSGIITDQDNQPLSGAKIFIRDMNKGTIADLEGKYELKNLPSGKIKIEFSFIGFANIIETVNLKNSDIKLDVTMHQTPLEVEEIVVSGGYNSTQHENAVKIDILNLKTNTGKVSPNFMEVLTSIPGVNMISKGNGVSKPVIRGLSMNDVLVLDNSVRYENYQYSSHHPLGIDEFGVSDVEIIKGPASLLYGSDAIGGVINFIREKPASMGTFEGDYNLQLFTNSLGLNQNIGIKGASNSFFGGIRAGQKTNADYLQGGGTFVPNSRFNEVSAKLNMGFTDKIGTFNLFYDFSNRKSGLVEDEAVESITKRDRKNDIFYQQFNTHLLSSRNKVYLDRFRLELNGAYQNTELVHFAEKDNYEIQMRLGTLTYDAKLYFPSNLNSEYIVGFQGFNQTNTNLNNRETFLLPDAKTNNYSAFTLLQQTLFNKWRIQGGFRYDHKTISTQSVGLPTNSDYRPAISKLYNSFSGSMGSTYHVNDFLLLRMNLAAAYRTPNLAELTSNGQHELRYEVGNHDLKPENSYEADISLHLHKNNFTFDIAGFYNLLNNYIYLAPSGERTEANIPIYQYTQSNSYLYGGESGLHIHPINIEWLHLKSTFSSVIGKKSDGNYLPFIPAHKWRNELRVEKSKLCFLQKSFISITTTTAFNQYRIDPNETPTNGYSLLDINLGGKINIASYPVRLNIGINNVFDTKYIDHLSLLKEVNYFEPGRNIVLALSIPFGTGL
ncbi:MAG: TonB-dependent receptor [Dysgonamonadaceae bacterium]|jgi:iron complex outermembrane receptor protein|nr:TonB-dependent receptor [Dysgonamonadaceae bacterium]